MSNAHFDPPPPEHHERAPRPKDAATLVLVRRDGAKPRVLMGQRARGHVFMPDKWVFPGGRVDRTDALAPAATEMSPETEASLADGNVRRKPRAFPLTAVRETYEETGLVVGKANALHGPAPEGWRDYAAHRAAPELHKFAFICRAITPPHRARRFDARFFFALAEDVLLDDARHAHGDELLHIKWFELDEALELDLPSVTRFVLGETKKRLAGQAVEPQFLRWRRGGQPRPELA